MRDQTLYYKKQYIFCMNPKSEFRLALCILSTVNYKFEYVLVLYVHMQKLKKMHHCNNKVNLQTKLILLKKRADN